MEDYPSPAEGNGLENRQACKSAQGFESLILLFKRWASAHRLSFYYRGVEQLAARRAHNPKVTGSSPVPAIAMIVGALATLRTWYTWVQAHSVTYD
jgi:hypothetical protein